MSDDLCAGNSSGVSFDSGRPLPPAEFGPVPQPFASVPELLEVLALSPAELEAFTAEDSDPYERFTRPKRDRSRRSISKPVPRLMATQRMILKLIVERLPAHDASHGHRIGRSTTTNAAVHVDADVVVKADLQNFSSWITFPRVLGVFRHAGYPRPVACALALLCTARDAVGVRRLPQGAPTTSGLANAVCFRFDHRLSGLASGRGWRFTRYGDDLTFSLPAGAVETSPDELLGAIKRIVRDEGFCLNKSKTRVVRSTSSQRVTGLVVNGPGAPRVPREVKRQLRAAAHNLQHKSAQDAASPPETSGSRIDGKTSR